MLLKITKNENLQLHKEEAKPERTKSLVSSIKSRTVAAGEGGGCGQARVHRVTDEDALAQDKGEADYLNTQRYDTQLETIGNWVRRTGGT